MKNNKNNRIITLLPIIFILVGLLLIVLSIYFYIENSKFIKSAIKTEAEIAQITTSRDSDGDITHHVDVVFYVNGKTYKGDLGEYTSSMYEGKSIAIYYNPQNPNDFRTGSKIVTFILLPMGLIFFAIGFLVFYPSIKSKSLAKLKDTGKRIDAKINGISLNTSYSVNDRHPYIIDCSYFNEIEDKLYSFTSQNIWTDVQPIIDAKNITTIPVYMDENDPTKYFVDISIFDNYIGN